MVGRNTAATRIHKSVASCRTYAWSRAYASAAYLRVADVEEKVTVNLIASKYRLAPPSGRT